MLTCVRINCAYLCNCVRYSCPCIYLSQTFCLCCKHSSYSKLEANIITDVDGDLRDIQEFRPEEEGIAAYIERVQVFFKANSMEEERQVPVLLSVIKGKMYSMLRDLLAPDRPDSKTFTQLTETLMEHFQPKPLALQKGFTFTRGTRRRPKPSDSTSRNYAN